MAGWGTEMPPKRDPAPGPPAQGRSGSWRAVILCALGAIVAVVAVVVTFLPAGWIGPVDVAFLVVGSVAPFATGAFAVAILGIRGAAAAFAAALIVAAATIFTISLVLSLLDSYDRSLLIAGNLVVLAVMVGLWIRGGRRRPLLHLPSLGDLRVEAAGHPYLTAILLALALAMGVEAVLALGVAPNNYDSMFYHLSRIGYWMQNDSILPFDGGSIFQLQHPPNAEILQAWTMELIRGDRFAQFVQWLALAGLVCVIYAGARFLDFSRAASLFAAAVFGTLPLPVLEATSTQNDLVAAFFVSAAALFLIRAVASSRPGDGIVGALALGLAVGTKGTVFFALPGLALLVAAAMWRWRPPRRFVAAGSALLVVAVLVLGSPTYVQTAVDTGGPFGEAGSVKARTEPLPQSAGKTLWGFVDLPGRNALPPVGDLIASGEQAVWGDYPGSSPDMDVHEDFTGFGPIGLLLLLPLLAVTALRRRGPGDRRLLAVVALSYIVLFVIFVAAQPFDMRLMIIPVALGAPLLAGVVEVPWLRRSTVVVALVCLMPVLFANQQKPLLPGNFSLGMGPAAQRAGSNLGFEEMIRHTERAIGADQRIGYVGTPIDWDYPLFGPRLDRFVVRLPYLGAPADVRAAMDDHNLDAIVWGLEPPPGVRATLVNESDPPKRGTTRWVSNYGRPGRRPCPAGGGSAMRRGAAGPRPGPAARPSAARPPRTGATGEGSPRPRSSGRGRCPRSAAR